MSQDLRRGIIVSLLSLIAVLLSVEGFLRLVDPLDVYSMTRYTATIHRYAAPHDFGYIMLDGRYGRAGSALTIEGGTRALPDTNPEADCTIIVLGDSMTFGWRVRDEEAWPNLLAKAYSDVRFINTALPGYSVWNIRKVMEQTPGDGYLYLFYMNDGNLPAFWQSFWDQHYQAGVGSYLIYASRDRDAQGLKWPEFEEDLAFVTDRDNILIMGDQNDPLTRWLIGRYPDQAVPIPWPAETVSRVDVHPSVESHRQLASAIVPLAEDWLSSICA